MRTTCDNAEIAGRIIMYHNNMAQGINTTKPISSILLSSKKSVHSTSFVCVRSSVAPPRTMKTGGIDRFYKKRICAITYYTWAAAELRYILYYPQQLVVYFL